MLINAETRALPERGGIHNCELLPLAHRNALVCTNLVMRE